MAFEIFSRKSRRVGTPVVSITKIGSFAFNKSAADILQKDALEFLLLMWDATTGSIGMKTTSNKKDTRAYRIRYMDKGNGATFSAKTFLDHYGIDYSARTPIPIELNTDKEIFLEFKVPESLLKKRPQQRTLTEVASRTR
jgi:hypothetical protein